MLYRLIVATRGLRVLAFAAVVMAALPVSAQKPPAADPARVASAKAMMTAAGVSKQFDTIMPLIFRQMQTIFLQQHPPVFAPFTFFLQRLPISTSLTQRIFHR